MMLTSIKNPLLHLHGKFSLSPSSRYNLFPLPSLSLKRWNKFYHFTFLLLPAGRFCPPSQPLSVGYFILYWCLQSISLDPYGLVIFEDKGHICRVIAAMLISTSPQLVPGKNHYCFCKLGPALTMVILRLNRAAYSIVLFRIYRFPVSKVFSAGPWTFYNTGNL